MRALDYHHIKRVVNAGALGVAQQRHRTILIFSKDPNVLEAFVWPDETSHARRHVRLKDALLPPGEAKKSLFLNPDTEIARTLARPPPEGLARPRSGEAYSRCASAYAGAAHVPKRAHGATGTLTASSGSQLYIWEGRALRTLAAVERLRLFAFGEGEIEAFLAAARASGISETQLGLFAGDCFVVTLMERVLDALARAIVAAASDADVAEWEV